MSANQCVQRNVCWPSDVELMLGLGDGSSVTEVGFTQGTADSLAISSDDDLVHTIRDYAHNAIHHQSCFGSVTSVDQIDDSHHRRLRTSVVKSQPTTAYKKHFDTRPRCYQHGCGGRRFSCLENYQRHMRERDRKGSASCSFCLKTFSRKSNLDQHLLAGRCRALKRMLRKIWTSSGPQIFSGLPGAGDDDDASIFELSSAGDGWDGLPAGLHGRVSPGKLRGDTN